MLKKTFSGKKVLVTGNTGFKGSWLTLWLKELKAEVIGYSLEEPPTTPCLFDIANLEENVTQVYGDIRDLSTITETIKTYRPQVIFHLAAQPIVLHSFEKPIETFETNAIGTANLLEASRDQPDIEAIVVITTDKCYDNKEWVWGYREIDPLGGHDPYSASKAMTELVTASYRHSFYSNRTPIASARAGNVIGGGDFSDYRLIPDSMKALMNNSPIEVRNPKSTRPWMHVLDPLHGYLMLAQKLMEKGQLFAEAWNFGPREHEAISTSTLVERAIALWGDGDWIDRSSPQAKKEMNTLKLNWDKAANRLNWSPLYSWEESLEETVKWFKAFKCNENMKAVCSEQIKHYENRNEIYTYTS